MASCPDGEKSCTSEDNSSKLITGWDHKHITLIIPRLNKTLHSGLWFCSYGGKHSDPAELTVYGNVYFSFVIIRMNELTKNKYIND